METKNTTNKILETTKDILGRVGFEAEVKIAENDYGKTIPVVCINSSNDLSMLIGKNGQNLCALEHLIRLLVFKSNKDEAESEQCSFMVDINNYRKSRTRYILDAAKEVAQRVIGTQKPEALVPMNPFERRLVHTELAAYKDIQTESIGEEPRRRVVIKPLSFD